MSIDITDGIDQGNLKIKVITTNEISVTVQADPKFGGMVTQPSMAAAAYLGEHGLGVYIEVKIEDETHSILFDTGGMNGAILHNVNPMNINLNQIEKVILSHGHFDHFGSLANIVPELHAGCEIFLHPNAFIQNEVVFSKPGVEIDLDNFSDSITQLKEEGQILRHSKLPPLNRETLEQLVGDNEIQLIETTQPEKLYSGIATSGEIEISDPSEVTPGFYLFKSPSEGEIQTFRDEIALYFNVKEKGLVLLTGCGHTGIINIVRHAQKITGIDKIYAIIGGFHLEGMPSEKLENIIQQLEEFNPEIICGMHCTGLMFNAKMLGHPTHVLGVTGTEFNF